MKRIMIFAIAVVAALGMAAAGPRSPKDANLSKEERQARMLNARVKMMKERLLLTDEQTEKFIPLYKEYMDNMGKQFGRNKAKKPEVKTIEEAQAQVIADIDGKARVLEIQKEFIPRFAKILTAPQLVKFLPVEGDMQRMVRKERMRRMPHDSTMVKHAPRAAKVPRSVPMK